MPCIKIIELRYYLNFYSRTFTNFLKFNRIIRIVVVAYAAFCKLHTDVIERILRRSSRGKENLSKVER